jgi:hypothetical protein
MNLKLAIFILGFAAADVATVIGEAALVPSKIIASFFPGQNRLLLTWTNKSAVEITTEVDGTIFAASSKLAVPLPIHLKEKLRLLPNQAALMPVTIDLPEVRGKTLFVIRWQDSAKKPIGNTELHVYPRDILKQLGSSIGVISEDESFKNAFTKANLKFEEIQRDQLHDFRGQLLIVNGFPAATDAEFKAEIELAAWRRIVVVWITPDMQQDSALQPNFFLTPFGSGAVVFVQNQFVESFAENAASQLRLVQICRAATSPGRPGLPIIFSKDQNED